MVWRGASASAMQLQGRGSTFGFVGQHPWEPNGSEAALCFNGWTRPCLREELDFQAEAASEAEFEQNVC